MIDVDPGTSSDFDDVLVLTRLYRTALDHLGVRAAAKVTGKRGIQVWVPVADGYTFDDTRAWVRSEEHTSELQSLMRISYAVFCLKKKKNTKRQTHKTSLNHK